MFWLTNSSSFNSRVGEALIFGSWMLGQALAYAPNVNAAVISAGRILRLLDRVPKYNNPKSQALPYDEPFVSSSTFSNSILK